ncbi:MAG: hypothetical protein DRO52_01915 [Candidatus Hecatellales archaeon]|nr:MAG: hypothetical protein DRO52_01915 [Candidatus Hecatellales archaeon]
MSYPKLLVEKFYRSTLNRNFAEAERLLAKIRSRLPRSDWGEGYLKALEGFLTTYKVKDDKYAFAARLPEDRGELLKVAQEFRARIESQVSSEFDRGFFSAWEYLVRMLAEGRLKRP